MFPVSDIEALLSLFNAIPNTWHRSSIDPLNSLYRRCDFSQSAINILTPALTELSILSVRGKPRGMEYRLSTITDPTKTAFYVLTYIKKKYNLQSLISRNRASLRPHDIVYFMWDNQPCTGTLLNVISAVGIPTTYIVRSASQVLSLTEVFTTKSALISSLHSKLLSL